MEWSVSYAPEKREKPSRLPAVIGAPESCPLMNPEPPRALCAAVFVVVICVVPAILMSNGPLIVSPLEETASYGATRAVNGPVPSTRTRYSCPIANHPIGSATDPIVVRSTGVSPLIAIVGETIVFVAFASKRNS